MTRGNVMGILTAHIHYASRRMKSITYTNITEQYITNAFLATIIVPCIPTQAYFYRCDSQWITAACPHDEIVEIFTI